MTNDFFDNGVTVFFARELAYFKTKFSKLSEVKAAISINFICFLKTRCAAQNIFKTNLRSISIFTLVGEPSRFWTRPWLKFYQNQNRSVCIFLDTLPANKIKSEFNPLSIITAAHMKHCPDIMCLFTAD